MWNTKTECHTPSSVLVPLTSAVTTNPALSSHEKSLQRLLPCHLRLASYKNEYWQVSSVLEVKTNWKKKHFDSKYVFFPMRNSYNHQRTTIQHKSSSLRMTHCRYSLHWSCRFSVEERVLVTKKSNPWLLFKLI